MHTSARRLKRGDRIEVDAHTNPHREGTACWHEYKTILDRAREARLTGTPTTAGALFDAGVRPTSIRDHIEAGRLRALRLVPSGEMVLREIAFGVQAETP